ncbi:anti-sigma factor [Mesobacillus maritimus]|uniref:anti-sigma factor n=1 Tax=Mesobacillus maritimus TaxID=1643336 RepID=UPI00203E6AF1|nr:anti-sigma factor [Mesobacillus maritimus]MCM3584789.1 anti-sigma factor [Mesobacillus maritimus]MCM3671842.1 anti-sigma factor [Mesobacillus maritimus]
MSKKHFSEEVLIDFCLEEISEERRQEIREHLDNCAECKQVTEHWLEVFNQSSNGKPSAELKDRIWENARKNRGARKKNRKLMMAISSAAALFIFSIGLLWDQSSEYHRYEVAHNGEIPTESIQTNPQTQQLAVIPVAANQNINGNLWINGVDEELLLEVDGLEDISNRDYQLWMIYDNNKIKGELLSTVDGSSRILIKGKDVNHFKIIKASIEPIGGSLEPTGPETFVVPLNK